MHSGHLIRFPATSIPLSENSCIDHIAVQKFPAERLIIWQQAALVLQLEPPVVVVDCSSIRLERHRAVCIPSQKQGPVVWVIFFAVVGAGSHLDCGTSSTRPGSLFRKRGRGYRYTCSTGRTVPPRFRTPLVERVFVHSTARTASARLLRSPVTLRYSFLFLHQVFLKTVF